MCIRDRYMGNNIGMIEFKQSLELVSLIANRFLDNHLVKQTNLSWGYYVLYLVNITVDVAIAYDIFHDGIEWFIFTESSMKKTNQKRGDSERPIEKRRESWPLYGFLTGNLIISKVRELEEITMICTLKELAICRIRRCGKHYFSFSLYNSILLDQFGTNLAKEPLLRRSRRTRTIDLFQDGCEKN
eukprot:TRINITY_DN5897_c0_g1_i5.p4 TRINITY_DN5897_c0_g1~~TRINITY_DN5897_c0_g1_i5.p4  ORF type:complete len:216 (+),score=28.63 TRINITY_DN5897_c0_g1_i5:91-648(+)